MAKRPTINEIVRNALCARRSAFVRFLPRFKAVIGEKRVVSIRSLVSRVKDEIVEILRLVLQHAPPYERWPLPQNCRLTFVA